VRIEIVEKGDDRKRKNKLTERRKEIKKGKILRGSKE